MREPSFEKELEALINRHSLEYLSNTPDFMLAQYLGRCLENYQETVRARDQWNRSDTTTWLVRKDSREWVSGASGSWGADGQR